MGFLEWYDSIWGKRGNIDNFVRTVQAMNSEEMLDNYWNSQADTTKQDAGAQAAYVAQLALVQGKHAGIENPLKPVILGMLNEWKGHISKYDLEDQTKADEKLAGLATDVLTMSASVAAIELALGAFPNGEGTVASTKVSQLMAWLGFGAVVTAVAHDPVKIGLLRPYQDTLEAHFRNRRPDSGDLFTAYQQRSLSATKIDDVEKITDDLMNKIEAENEKYYDTEIAKWGYSEYFANALKDATTKTLSFGNLMALAKQGRLNRGMAIYSLWGYGLDRKLMKVALDSLDEANTIANYAGFRAQIEPAYVEGDITEAELIDYWNKISIPADVQAAMIPRFRKKRDAWALKNSGTAPAKERDLTVSQIQSAYQNKLIERAQAQNNIITLGYSLTEAKILLDLAEMRRKLPGATTLKKLPLSDYEKAHKNGLLTLDDVLDRMKGEYEPNDIEIERGLLQIGKA
jgi:hypothetical protein